MKKPAETRPKGPKLSIWALGLLAAGGLGLLARQHGRVAFLVGEQPKKVTITKGRLPEGGLSGETRSEGPSPSPDEPASSCRVPELREGVIERDIAHSDKLKWAKSGGGIEKGRYRLVGAYSLERAFKPGRWSIALDLSDEQQGAYYRKMGLSAQSSRIKWSAKGGIFQIETLCPDQGEKRSFEYGHAEGKLQLKSEDGTIVVLEPYAQSQLIGLPPLSR